MTIVYVLISVILGAVLGYGLAWVQGFWQMARAKRRLSPPVSFVPNHSSERVRGWNDAVLNIALDMERAGNKVLAWQLRKRIKS
jgi:hypothetical protein